MFYDFDSGSDVSDSGDSDFDVDVDSGSDEGFSDSDTDISSDFDSFETVDVDDSSSFDDDIDMDFESVEDADLDSSDEADFSWDDYEGFQDLNDSVNGEASDNLFNEVSDIVTDSTEDRFADSSDFAEFEPLSDTETAEISESIEPEGRLSGNDPFEGFDEVPEISAEINADSVIEFQQIETENGLEPLSSTETEVTENLSDGFEEREYADEDIIDLAEDINDVAEIPETENVLAEETETAAEVLSAKDVPEDFAEYTEETADEQSELGEDAENTSEELSDLIENTKEISSEPDELFENEDEITYEQTELFEDTKDVSFEDIHKDTEEQAAMDIYELDGIENVSEAEEELDQISEESDTDAKTASQMMSEYMNEHNYSINDQQEYMQDPEWQRLSQAFREENGFAPLEPKDEVEDHVSDVHDYFVGRGVPENSKELEAILDNERQGITEIVNERGKNDVLDESFDEYYPEQNAISEIVSEEEMETPEYPESFDEDELEDFSDPDITEKDTDELEKVPETIEQDNGNIMEEGLYDESHFDGLETETLENGTSVIKGNHFEEYINDYYNSDNMEYEPYDDREVIETVNTEDIEGVHLGQYDMEDSSAFWDMRHVNSRDFFMETASHIPEVQEALNNGTDLDEIKQNEALRDCATIYFDPENMVKVEKINDYYTFDGDGRHRVIAARRFGYDIPVRISGERKTK